MGMLHNVLKRALERKRMIGIALCVVVGVVFLYAGCADEETEGSITMTNGGSRTIVVWNLTPSDSDVWGVNQLGSRTISSGDSFRLTAVSCKRSWDFRVVDSAGFCRSNFEESIPCGGNAGFTYEDTTNRDFCDTDVSDSLNDVPSMRPLSR